MTTVCGLTILGEIRMQVSVFRPRGVPGPTSKIVAACPSPDGLARDGTQGGKTVSRVILRQGGALAVGVTSVREGERERESVRACLSARPPARPPAWRPCTFLL
jgi:hypothetical protein